MTSRSTAQLTMGENVADLGGLMLAYMAWKNETRGQKLEPIDGFTPGAALLHRLRTGWCSNTRDETKRMYATIDPHSPDKYRANGVVSNHPGISAGLPVQGRFRDGAGEEMQSLVSGRASDLGRRTSDVGLAVQ